MQCSKGFAALIDMEGGFRLLPEVIKDRQKMKPICVEIIEFSKYCDDILAVFKDIP